MVRTFQKPSTSCGKEIFSQTYPQEVKFQYYDMIGFFFWLRVTAVFVPIHLGLGETAVKHCFPVIHRPYYNNILLYLHIFLRQEGPLEVPMTDLLATAYPWIKALHVMAVISWMAGLFYLPRLFVYHAERGHRPGEPVQSFEIMEEKLLRVIMNPAMIVAWLAGILLVMTPGIVSFSEIWPWTKAIGIFGMTWFHMWLAVQRKALLAGRGLSGRRYRMMNEVPTLLMVLIVISVIVKF